jgi:penicillin V acylase-like amidase (Ntn superfamily)
MKKRLSVVILFVFCGCLSFNYPNDNRSCSTFMLQHKDQLIVGHNVDHGHPLSGLVIINKRNVFKKGKTWKQFSTNEAEPSPRPTWTSKYGSVTFNATGYGLPDGGVNEMGLFIWEMTLEGSQFIEDEELPKLFMEAWMQYQLDNHETIDQVIRSASEIAMDGWDWHFFTADASGRSSSIEFLEGKPVIHAGESMPVTALCNSQYAKELKLLKEYEGFGGDKRLWLSDKKVPRFVHAAKMSKDYMLHGTSSIVDYGLRILETLERGGTQWSVVCDIKNRHVYFRTASARSIRSFSLDAFDFSYNSPVKVLDINKGYSGDVSKRFIDYRPELNREFVAKGLDSLFGRAETSKMQEIGFIGKGITKEMLIDRLAGYPESWKSKKQ